MKHKPPFSITNQILKLSQEVAFELGVLSGAKLYPTPVKLRKKNKIKTIQASLAIEGNSLTTENITDIIEGKRVLAPQKDIKEVQNAILVYEKLSIWDALQITNLQKCHALLMDGLTQNNGSWRTESVGIFKGKELTHMAPPAKKLPQLMENLFKYLQEEQEISWLIKACIFHYEMEFIHPFIDGNGRMGRLWQQLLLMKHNPIFEFISVETIIKRNQQQYYDVLSLCDKQGECTAFIIFSLEQILATLKEYNSSTTTAVKDCHSRLEYAKKTLENQWFTRKQYLAIQTNISTSTASRDLLQGVKNGILEKKGQNNQVYYKILP